MNNYNDFYQKFLNENSGEGYLKIRAYAASESIPIADLKIIVSKTIGNEEVIFFEGNTDESGTIEKIILPAPPLNNDNLTIPNKTKYKITATYSQKDFIEGIYYVNIYEGICVMQNIIMIPKIFNLGEI